MTTRPPLLHTISDTIDFYERSDNSLPIDVQMLLLDCAAMVRKCSAALMNWRIASDMYRKQQIGTAADNELLLLSSVQKLHELTDWIDTRVVGVGYGDE